MMAYYHFRGENPEMVRMGAEESPLIFQLYGSLKQPASLVLTENNLLDFLAAVIAKDPPLPHNVLSALRDRNKSLLFLGFGFKHWYLRILLHVLQGRDKDSRSFALEQCVPGNVDEFQRTIMFFRMSDYKITICAKELRSFVRELHVRYTERPAAHMQELDPSHAPTVFLCHAKQNRAEAEDLRNQLKAAGFNAWFDEEDLRGGDEWDRTIERAIEKEIEYFVVLQSEAMTAKYESYFHKEIRLALKRQESFRVRIDFIIPTKIDDCPLLEELKHLQTADLSDKANIKELISIINRDQQRRKMP